MTLLYGTEHYSFNKNNRNLKRIKVVCEGCNQERVCRYWHALQSFQKTQKNLCKICIKTKEHAPAAQKRGENHPNFGKKRPEHSKIMSGDKNPFYGKTHTEETKKIISKTNIGRNVGEKSPRYKPPEERSCTLDRQIRNLFQYKSWRFFCFKRDNFSCQECGCKNVMLCVDHIKPFSVIIKENNVLSTRDAEMCEELWDTNNGKTLSWPCHRKTDTYGCRVQKILKEIK